MKTILVSTTTEYAVKIGANLLSYLGREAKAVVTGNTAVIVSDSNVWPLYGNQATKQLEKWDFSVLSFVFPAGEASKNFSIYLKLLNYLAENHITRTDFLVALGGGVVGDLCGFAAATYLRGIDYIQVPTTLLAMVDSSVGGKTAIDLPAGKNLVGAFYQPKLVLCDTSLLETLPEQVFLDGCSEVIKYGILFDLQLFAHLQEKVIRFDRDWVINRCIEQKRDVVEKDEFDQGLRQLLNLGHTFGHSIEKESNYTLSHGYCVAIGIAMAARCAAAKEICTQETAKTITALLDQFSLPTQSPYTAETLIRHAFSDKKRASDHITLILPATIGCCKRYEIPISQMKDHMEAGFLWI